MAIPECEVSAPQTDGHSHSGHLSAWRRENPDLLSGKNPFRAFVCCVRKTEPEPFCEKPHSVSEDCSPASPSDGCGTT
jgi:hypothetical protein